MRNLPAFVFIFLVNSLSNPFVIQAQSTLLDDFNRTAGNSLTTTGLPWLETESAGSDGSKIRLVSISASNQVVQMSACNADNSAPVSGNEQISMNMTGRYATVFNTATTTLEWYFNFRNPQSSPSGFGTTTYGIAFVLGCDEANFTSSTADGYAVVIGNSGSPDPVRLVAFQNGLSVNSNITDIISSGTTVANNYYSVKVTFNPCTKQWSLAVRDDGSTAFTDPKTGTLGTALTAFHYTHTRLDLSYLGALWQHSTGCTGARFDNFYIPTASAAANQYVWNGTTTDYRLATNWTPSRNCPRMSDVLLWNASSPSNATVTNVPTDTVGQIVISDNRTVTLRTPNAGGTKTISLSGGTGTDFQVASGSSLVMDADTGMVINLLTGATAAIGGTVTFINTANGSPRSHRLQAADAGAIVFQSGAVFTAADLSGNPFGGTGQANTVLFQSGSTYVSQDGASPFGLAQPASKVVFQSGSLFKLEQGIGFQLLGRTYANVEINTTSVINNLFGGSGVATMDNLNFVQGTLNFQLSSNNQPLNLVIKGNLTVQSGATLNFNPGNASAKSSLTLSGSAMQTISGTGTINLGNNTEVIFDNASGFTLNRNLTTAGTVHLKTGLIHAPANELFLNNQATNALTTTDGFVNGALRRKLLSGQPYAFPVGNASHVQNSLIQFATTDCITDVAVRFHATDPNTTSIIPFTENGLSFSQLLTDGYWECTTNCGNALASEYRLQLYPNQFGGYGQNGQPFTIAKRVGSGNWQQNGSLSNPDGHASQVQNDLSVIRTGLAGFSNFAIATTVEPLPVRWLSFTSSYENGQTQLEWITTDEQNNYGFEVQWSPDGRLFQRIGFVSAASNQPNIPLSYSFADASGNCGYYRLQQRDWDGHTAYSKIVPVRCQKPADPAPVVYPNPITEHSELIVPNATDLAMKLFTVQGKVLGQWQGSSEILSSALQCQSIQLAAGVYILELHQAENVWRLKVVKN